MIFVEEVSIEPDTVELVISISLVELLKNVQLLQTSLVPVCVCVCVQGEQHCEVKMTRLQYTCS